jgi:hypothetical protein
MLCLCCTPPGVLVASRATSVRLRLRLALYCPLCPYARDILYFRLFSSVMPRQRSVACFLTASACLGMETN